MLLKDKICLITGASSGIGKSMATALADMGARVIWICRSREKGKLAIQDACAKTKSDRLELWVTDLSSLGEVRNLANRLSHQHPRIDLLVNNAGGINPQRTTTVDGIEATFAVNHLAHFLLTNLLLEQLRESRAARIINVTSQVHRFANPVFDDLGFERGYKPARAYCLSKLANLLFTYELARRLKGTSVSVNAFHPGGVRTDFGRDLTGVLGLGFKVARPFMRTPEKGAETGIWLASSPSLDGITGRYFLDKKEIRSSKASYDPEVARELWEISAKLTGLESSSSM